MWYQSNIRHSLVRDNTNLLACRHTKKLAQDIRFHKVSRVGGMTSEGRHVGLVGRDRFTCGVNTQSARDWHREWVGGRTPLERQFFVADKAAWGVVDRFGEYLGHSSCGVMKMGLSLLFSLENYQGFV